MTRALPVEEKTAESLVITQTSAMSARGAPIGHRQVKRALGLEPAAPPRLALGESETGVEPNSCGHDGALRDRRGRKGPSVQSSGAESGEGSLRKQGGGRTGVKQRAQVTQKMATLNGVFSPVVACFTCGGTSCERGARQDPEYHPVAFVNAQARDFVEVSIQQPGGHSVSAQDAQQQSSKDHRPAAMGTKTTGARTPGLFVRLIRALRYRSKTRPSGAGKTSRYGDGVRSFRKRAFWRQKMKKPSPFFMEPIGESQECIKEETILLARERVHDDAAQPGSPGPSFKGEVKGRFPEMLTVSVDVSVLALGSAHGDTTPSEELKDEAAVEEPRRSLQEAATGTKGIQIGPFVLEDNLIPRRGVASPSFRFRQASETLHGRELNVNACGASAGGHRGGEECKSDSITTGHRAAPAEVFGDAAAGGPSAEGSAAAQNLPLDTAETAQSLGAGQRPVRQEGGGAFDAGSTRGEANAEQDRGEREAILLEAARSVVQVSLRAALDQFRDSRF